MRPQHRPAAGRAPETREQEARAPSVELALPNSPRAPASARAAITAAMAAHLAEAVLADALLVVAELVTNSVRHAHAHPDAPITLRAELRRDVVHVEVLDGGRGGPVARRAPDLKRGGGFGLNLVATLSDGWGVDDVGGTRVWAELARTQHTNGRPSSDRGTAPERTPRDGRRPDGAALLVARAHAAVRRAATACDAATRAHDNARRALERHARLRAQPVPRAGVAPSDTVARQPAASPFPPAAE